jgi:hypothetical protein
MAPTELDFGPTRGNFEDLWVFDEGLEPWLASRGVSPVHLSIWSGDVLQGYQSQTKIGGVVVHPAETILGIRAWEDAYEGILSADGGQSSAPWVLFDVEKIVRMMLRQSGLAFEILASPIVAPAEQLEASFPAHRVVEAAIHDDILLYYRDCADSIRWSVEGLESGEYRRQIVDAVRHALTGLALIDGRVEFDLRALLEDAEPDIREAVHALLADDTVSPDLHELLRHRLASWCERLEAPGRSVLGHKPDDYDWLDELVARQRLQSRDS